MKMNLVVSILFLLASGVASPVGAEIATLEPVSAEVVDSPSGLSNALLLFDLSSLLSADGRVIDDAILEWAVSAISDDSTTYFDAWLISSEWAQDDAHTITIETSPHASWEITPSDHAAGFGQIIRLNLTDFVRAWAQASLPNYGVMISTSALSAEECNLHLASPTLTIRYGFVRSE